MTTNNAINAPIKYFEPFSPTISGTSAAGVGTYTTQVGYWSGIGNFIYVQLKITWTAHTGTGDMTVTDLPFVCRNISGYDPELILNIEDVLLPPTTVCLFGHMTTGTSTVVLETIRSLGNNVPISMEAAGTLHLSGVYLK